MATGNLVIGGIEGAGPRRALSELLLAWARDIATGEPRYILELTREQRGANCGCECASCGQPLTAVNAAKSEFQMRPHFRHPVGAARNECLILAARAAVLHHLREDGWLDLPRRRMSSQAIGLSGEHYDAWVEAPAEKVRISSVDFRDRTFAMLNLKDGRRLRVQLTGTAGGSTPEMDEAGLPIPTIFLDSDDLSVAAMEPAEIRRHLQLVPDGFRWCSHWQDQQLQADADAAANKIAGEHLDALPAGLELPEDMDPALKWQTVLHYEVKNILAEACELMAPSMERTVELEAPDGRVLRESVFEDAEMLEITHASLEHRFGRVVPDVLCEGWAAGGIWLMPLLIEVTVTNQIDEERLARIQSMDAYALEIDLSLTGGRVTRDELRRLVVHEIAMKRWLYFPNFESRVADVYAKLRHQVDKEFGDLEAIARVANERRALVLATPLRAIAEEYLSNVSHLLEIEQREGNGFAAEGSLLLAAREGVADSADKLALHGFPEAGESNLVAGRGILSRVLSIRADKGVGYDVHTGHAVLNAIRQSRHSQELSFFTIYFIAVRAFKPHFTSDQQRKYDDWTLEVKESIQRGETKFLRDPAYDKLLSVLFPEMAAGLSKDFGKRGRSTVGAGGQPIRQQSRDKLWRTRAAYLETQPKTSSIRSRLLDTPPESFWLKGRDLDAWRIANPDWARWFGGDA